MLNITLIGMPSAGKSFLGKKLADDLGMDFVDFDHEIFKKHGNVFYEKGEEEFLKHEDDLLSNASGKNMLFSPGGSCVYSDKGMKNLRKVSTVIWLDVPIEILSKRLGDFSKRAVVGSANMSLAELFETRRPLYENYAHHKLLHHMGTIDDQYDKLLDFATKIKIKHVRNKNSN